MIGITDLHQTWGTDNYHTHALLQGLDVFTCYEAVEEQLSTYTKERYQQEPDKVIQEVFDIYRSINIVPINYYTEAGVVNAINNLQHAGYNEVEGRNGQATIGLGNNQGQSINRFLFPKYDDCRTQGSWQ